MFLTKIFLRQHDNITQGQLKTFILMTTDLPEVLTVYRIKVQSFPNNTRGYRWLSLAALAGRVAGRHTDTAPKHSLLFQLSFRVFGHAHQRTFAKRRR